MQFIGGITAGNEMLGEIVNHHFCGTEDQAKFDVFNIDKAAEDFKFRSTIDFVINLFDGRHCEGLGFDMKIGRILGERLDQRFNRPGKCGRKEHGLAFSRGMTEDGFDVI